MGKYPVNEKLTWLHTATGKGIKLDTKSNGLTYLIDRMKGQPIYAHINLEKGERSKLADLASNFL